MTLLTILYFMLGGFIRLLPPKRQFNTDPNKKYRFEGDIPHHTRGGV